MGVGGGHYSIRMKTLLHEVFSNDANKEYETISAMIDVVGDQVCVGGCFDWDLFGGLSLEWPSLSPNLPHHRCPPQVFILCCWLLFVFMMHLILNQIF